MYDASLYVKRVEIQERMKKAGVKIRDIALKLGKPYGTMAGKLNGYTPLYPDEKKAIEDYIESVEKKQGNRLPPPR